MAKNKEYCQNCDHWERSGDYWLLVGHNKKKVKEYKFGFCNLKNLHLFENYKCNYFSFKTTKIIEKEGNWFIKIDESGAGNVGVIFISINELNRNGGYASIFLDEKQCKKLIKSLKEIDWKLIRKEIKDMEG